MAKAAVADSSQGISRREFLYYIQAASIALFAAEFTGLLIWFLIPRFRAGEFGGLFPLSLDAIPPTNEPPTANDEGRFWLVQLDSSQPNELMYPVQDDPSGGINGVAAIYKVCTHLGCIYAWNQASNRFECPCHGSKYRLDGRRIESPAPRTLDRMKIIAYDANGSEIAASELDDDGQYLPINLPPETASIAVDTGDVKQGPAQPLLCTFTGTCP